MNNDQRRYITTSRSNPLLPLAVGCGIACCSLLAKYIIDVCTFLFLIIFQSANNYRKLTDGNENHTYSFANYYKGGFEKEMTKREAALILGVRFVLGRGVLPESILTLNEFRKPIGHCC